MKHPTWFTLIFSITRNTLFYSRMSLGQNTQSVVCLTTGP